MPIVDPDLHFRNMMAQLDVKYAELRELTREANGVLKDIRYERRETEKLIQGLPSRIEQIISDAVVGGLEHYTGQLKDAVDIATQKVYDRFDTIAGICLGEDALSRREGKPALEELIRLYLQEHRPGFLRPEDTGKS